MASDKKLKACLAKTVDSCLSIEWQCLQFCQLGNGVAIFQIGVIVFLLRCFEECIYVPFGEMVILRLNPVSKLLHTIYFLVFLHLHLIAN